MGKVSVSLIQYYLRFSSVEFYLQGQTLRYVDIIKAISYLRLFNKLCVGTQAFRNLNLIDHSFFRIIPN